MLKALKAISYRLLSNSMLHSAIFATINTAMGRDCFQYILEHKVFSFLWYGDSVSPHDYFPTVYDPVLNNITFLAYPQQSPRVTKSNTCIAGCDASCSDVPFIQQKCTNIFTLSIGTQTAVTAVTSLQRLVS